MIYRGRMPKARRTLETSVRSSSSEPLNGRWTTVTISNSEGRGERRSWTTRTIRRFNRFRVTAADETLAGTTAAKRKGCRGRYSPLQRKKLPLTVFPLANTSSKSFCFFIRFRRGSVMGDGLDGNFGTALAAAAFENIAARFGFRALKEAMLPAALLLFGLVASCERHVRRRYDNIILCPEIVV